MHAECPVDVPVVAKHIARTGEVLGSQRADRRGFGPVSHSAVALTLQEVIQQSDVLSQPRSDLVPVARDVVPTDEAMLEHRFAKLAAAATFVLLVIGGT